MKRGSLKRAESWTGFLLAVPALAAFGLVILYPLLRTVALSLYEYTLFTPEPIFTGLTNFREILGRSELLWSWVRTLIFVFFATGLSLLFGMIWAVLVHQPFRGRGVVRSLALLPWVLPSVVSAFLWAWIANGHYGVFNGMLLQLGIIEEPVVWLSSPVAAMATVVLAKTWITVPLFMAFFLAGLQNVSQEGIDAARVDGAGNFQVLWHIVLPHLRATTAIIAIIGALGNLQHFDLVYALTGGGPIRSTTVLSIEVYRQAFQDWNIGLAAAIGFLWLVTIAVPAIAYLRTLFAGEDEP